MYCTKALKSKYLREEQEEGRKEEEEEGGAREGRLDDCMLATIDYRTKNNENQSMLVTESLTQYVLF